MKDNHLPDEPTDFTDADLDELVSHAMSLRKDFLQDLLGAANVSRADRDRPKAELRILLRELINTDQLPVARVVRFLDEQEPGGKQHVFMLRPPKAYNDAFKDIASVHRRLARRTGVKDLLGAELPLVMPEDLTLSSVRLADGMIEVVGVEARRYFERDERYDEDATSEDGLPIELRAYVERVARSTVVLRWNVTERHAGLHITQATSRGLSRNHYRDVRDRFAQVVSPWLDLDEFKNVNLRKVIHKLQQREQTATPWTRSRRGRWETDDGSEVEATSSSVDASLFTDRRVKAAVGQVSDADSGSSGNMYWLSRVDNPLHEPLHITIVASDSRIHFMLPSNPEAVGHVLQQIRRLL
jgi:hypothetical protein